MSLGSFDSSSLPFYFMEFQNPRMVWIWRNLKAHPVAHSSIPGCSQPGLGHFQQSRGSHRFSGNSIPASPHPPSLEFLPSIPLNQLPAWLCHQCDTFLSHPASGHLCCPWNEEKFLSQSGIQCWKTGHKENLWHSKRWLRRIPKETVTDNIIKLI